MKPKIIGDVLEAESNCEQNGQINLDMETNIENK